MERLGGDCHLHTDARTFKPHHRMRINVQSPPPEPATELPILQPLAGKSSDSKASAIAAGRARRMLVSIDFSPSSRRLLRKAAALARETRARLTMIYVQPQDWIEEDASNPLVAEAYRDLGEEAVARLRRLGDEEIEGDIEVNAEFRVGKWARTLAEAARREETDLLVVTGQEHRGLLGLVRVHPTQQLLRNAPCPVVVLPERMLANPPPMRQVVAAVGTSRSSRRAAKHAATLATELGLPLVLLHILPERGLGTRLSLANPLKQQKAIAESVRDKMLDWLSEEITAGLQAKVLIRSGFPVTRALERNLSLLNPELVVLGAGSRLGGKYVRTVLRSTFAPVVLVGPQSPAEPRQVRVPAAGVAMPVARAVQSRPAASPRPAESRSPFAGSSEMPKHKRILVVDDDRSVRESLDKLFKGEDCEVALAADGQEVIGKVDPSQFDLVLLDLKMQGANGWTTLRHLHSVKPELPVVLITGLPDRYKLANAAGVSALVEKPLDVPALLETVRDLLDAPGRESEPDPAGGCRLVRSTCTIWRSKLRERRDTPLPVAAVHPDVPA